MNGGRGSREAAAGVGRSRRASPPCPGRAVANPAPAVRPAALRRPGEPSGRHRAVRARSPGRTQAAGGLVRAPRAANFPTELVAGPARFAEGSQERERVAAARAPALEIRRWPCPTHAAAQLRSRLQLLRARRASRGGGGRGTWGAGSGRHGTQQHTAASSAVELVGVQYVQHGEGGGARRRAGPGRPSPLGRRGHRVAGGERRGSGPREGRHLRAPVHGVPGSGGRRRCGPWAWRWRRRRQRGAVPGSCRAARAHAGLPRVGRSGPSGYWAPIPGGPGATARLAPRAAPRSAGAAAAASAAASGARRSGPAPLWRPRRRRPRAHSPHTRAPAGGRGLRRPR